MITLSFDNTSGVLPTDTYRILSDQEDIGFCQLRHTPSKNIKLPVGFESHIYYEIEKEHRKKGCGSDAFGLLIKEAKKINLKEIIVTVLDSNSASVRMIEKSSGVLLSKEYSSDKDLYRKYSISLI